MFKKDSSNGCERSLGNVREQAHSKEDINVWFPPTSYSQSQFQQNKIEHKSSPPRASLPKCEPRAFDSTNLVWIGITKGTQEVTFATKREPFEYFLVNHQHMRKVSIRI